MALQPLPPIPNTRLVDAPDRDAIWRRYLEQVFALLSQVNNTGVVGPGSSTDNAIVRWNGTTGQAIQNSGVIIDDANSITGVSSATIGAHLTVNGNTILGDAGADALTINASTWTYGNNIAATRTAGTLATGTTNFFTQLFSFTGDSGGASNAIGVTNTVRAEGANAVATVRAFSQFGQHSGTNLVTNLQGVRAAALVNSTGGVTNATVFSAISQLTSTGAVANAFLFRAESPTLTSTGAITIIRGFSTANLGHASLVTNAVAFDADDMTASPTLTASYRTAQNSATGAWGFLHTGTANNAFNGNVRIGSTVAPTVALDVTGTAAISGGISFNTASKVSAYTYTGSDFAIYANASGAAFTLTVPHASSLPNKIFVAKKVDSTGNAVTVSSVSNIDGATTTSLAAQFTKIMFQSNGTQWFEI